MTAPLDPNRLLSVTQACALVGVSRRTVYNWITSGQVEYVRLPNGRARIVASSLTARVVTPNAAQHKQLWDLANRTREVLDARDRLLSTDVIQLLSETLTLLESLTK